MKQGSKSSLFLIELIIAILFFAVSSAICVQLFTTSHLKSQESVYRNDANLQAQTLIELYRNADGDLAVILELTDALEQDETYICYIDETGDYSSETSSDSYTVMMYLSDEDTLPTFTVDIYPPSYDTAIISYSTKIYVSEYSE